MNTLLTENLIIKIIFLLGVLAFSILFVKAIIISPIQRYFKRKKLWNAQIPWNDYEALRDRLILFLGDTKDVVESYLHKEGPVKALTRRNSSDCIYDIHSQDKIITLIMKEHHGVMKLMKIEAFDNAQERYALELFIHGRKTGIFLHHTKLSN